MQTVTIKQDLIDKLVKLSKRTKISFATDTNANWTNLKIDIQQQLSKLKRNVKAYDTIVYIMMAVTLIITFIKVVGDNIGPNLNQGWLFFFLTVSNMFTAFSLKLRIEKLEKQVLLLEILEKLDDRKE